MRATTTNSAPSRDRHRRVADVAGPLLPQEDAPSCRESKTRSSRNYAHRPVGSLLEWRRACLHCSLSDERRALARVGRDPGGPASRVHLRLLRRETPLRVPRPPAAVGDERGLLRGRLPAARPLPAASAAAAAIARRRRRSAAAALAQPALPGGEVHALRRNRLRRSAVRRLLRPPLLRAVPGRRGRARRVPARDPRGVEAASQLWLSLAGGGAPSSSGGGAAPGNCAVVLIPTSGAAVRVLHLIARSCCS